MELLYVDMLIRPEQFDYESYYFYINYIIGQKTYMHSHIGFANYVIKNYKNFKINDYLKYYENIYIFSSFLKSRNLEEIFENLDVFLNENKLVNILKKKRNLKRDELEVINNFNNYYNDIKNNLITKCNIILSLSNIQSNIDLIDNEIIYSDYSLFNRELKANDSILGELIYYNILTKEKLFVEGSLYEKILEVMIETAEEMGDEIEIEGIDLASYPLFKIPLSKQISKEHLQIIRKLFIFDFTTILDRIQEFRINNLHNDLDEALSEKLTAFYYTLSEELDLIQDKIDSNIYFQNIRNSDPEYKDIIVYMGLIPLTGLLQTYSSVRALTSAKVYELTLRIRKELGNIPSDIFIYYKERKEDEKEK